MIAPAAEKFGRGLSLSVCYLILCGIPGHAWADLGSLFFSESVENDPKSSRLYYVGFAAAGSGEVYGVAREVLAIDGGTVTHIVSIGDSINGFEVDSIGADSLELSKNGNVLQLPLSADGKSLAGMSDSVKPIRQTNVERKPNGASMAIRGGATTEAFKRIADAAGIPRTISDGLKTLPSPARSRSGRPGWALDSVFPELRRLGLPFKRGDILLTVDGVSVHDLEGLRAQVVKKQLRETYRVEIERAGQLLLLELKP